MVQIEWSWNCKNAIQNELFQVCFHKIHHLILSNEAGTLSHTCGTINSSDWSKLGQEECFKTGSIGAAWDSFLFALSETKLSHSERDINNLWFSVHPPPKETIAQLGNFLALSTKYHWMNEKIVHVVSYLTQVSDLDLAPDPEQFVASPPVRYIDSGCCVNFFQHLAKVVKICLRGRVQETQKLEPLRKLDNWLMVLQIKGLVQWVKILSLCSLNMHKMLFGW